MEDNLPYDMIHDRGTKQRSERLDEYVIVFVSFDQCASTCHRISATPKRCPSTCSSVETLCVTEDIQDTMTISVLQPEYTTSHASPLKEGKGKLVNPGASYVSGMSKTAYVRELQWKVTGVSKRIWLMRLIPTVTGREMTLYQENVEYQAR